MEDNTAQNSSKSKEMSAMKMVMVIILLFVSCVAALGFSVFYFVRLQASQRESATATALAVFTNEAATAHVHATATAVAHTTEVSSYEILDDFDSSHLDWYEKVEDNERWQGTITIRDGMYVWDINVVKDPGSFSYRGYHSQTTIENFDLSVDAMLAEGDPDLLCYGIAFRTSPRSLKSGSYMFSICDSGVYAVSYYDAEKKSEIDPWTPSPAIRPGEWNTLSVSAHDENVVLSINNAIVSEIPDAHVSKGYIYLLVRVFGDQPGTVYFDNFAFQPEH